MSRSTLCGSQFTNENTIIHGLDPVSGSGRVTLVANAQYYYNNPLDIFGLNYGTYDDHLSSYCQY